MPTTNYPVVINVKVYRRDGVDYTPGVTTWGTPVQSSGTWPNGVNFDDFWNRNSNPNWKMQIARGQDASTDYTRRVTNGLPGTFNFKTAYRSQNSPYYTFRGEDRQTFMVQRSINTMAIEDAAFADLALQRFKRKMNNRTQSSNLIIPLAELRELRQTVDGAATATMKVLIKLADVKKTLKSSLRTIKDPKRLKRALRNAYKDASNIWLTYSFGVSPMMSTILDINKSISSYLTRYDSIDRLTGSATKAWTNSFKTYPMTTCTGGTKGFLTEERFELQYKYIAGHKFSLTSANDYGALDHFGIRPPSLIPTIWELTAFSWVVDYFTTAGAFLDDTFSGTTGNSVYIIKNRRFTYKNVTSAYFGKQYPSQPYFTFEVGSLTPAVYESVEFQRTVLSSYPGRVLRFRTLDEMGLNGVSKLLNLASILSRSL